MGNEKRHLKPMGGGQITPGPVGPDGAPEPTEIVCIDTRKVYDFCFEEIVIPERTFTPPPGICTNLTGTASDFAVRCTILSAAMDTDQFVDCVEIGPRTPVGNGLFQVQVRVTVPVQIEVVNRMGGLVCGPVVTSFTFVRTAVLCAPPGTEVTCDITGTCLCDFDAVPGTTGTITITLFRCSFNLCLVLQSSAVVKLLVPSFGFCVPAPCRVAGLCPPSFPPQCEVEDGEF